MSETYAIIRDHGRELKVEEGASVLVDLREANAGDQIEFGEVLLVRSGETLLVGQPLVEGASVSGEITRQVAMEKLNPYKFQRRKGSHRKIGHRQKMLEVRIDSIRSGS